MGKRVVTVLVLALATALMAVGTASAAITVGNTNDSGPGSLRQAIIDAPPGETIDLPAGSYDLSSGPLEIERPLSIVGHGSGNTTLRTVSNQPVFVVSAEGSLALTDLAFRDMTIAAASGVVQGGLIANGAAPLSLQRVVITGVTIDVSGAAGNNGGVIQGGLILTIGPLALVETSIARNRILANGGSERNGGVIQGGLMISGDQTTLRNVALDENTFETKGGQGPSNPGQNGGVIQAGGILLSSSKESPSIIENVSLSANTGDASGGPGANGGVVQGLALLAGVSKGTLGIHNTTIAGNSARAFGEPAGIVQATGASVNGSSGGIVSIRGSTIYANRAEPAMPGSGPGNVLALGATSFGNTIVAGGVGLAGRENCLIGTGVSSVGFNLDSSDQCGFHGNGDRVGADPQLGPLQNNGGLGLTVVPGPAGAAVDQGASFGMTTDQRGVQRPIDLPTIANSAAPGADGSDIGAVELQPSNALKLGKLKKNRKKGRGVLTVTLPAPSAGVLVLEGTG
ncbi:MAG TPA: choice-of-anchor Q domain-containing protein, partial [Solirubrobacterales bacterium]